MCWVTAFEWLCVAVHCHQMNGVQTFNQELLPDGPQQVEWKHKVDHCHWLTLAKRILKHIYFLIWEFLFQDSHIFSFVQERHNSSALAMELRLSFINLLLLRYYAPNHYLNQCWLIVNWIIGHNNQWKEGKIKWTICQWYLWDFSIHIMLYFKVIWH